MGLMGSAKKSLFWKLAAASTLDYFKEGFLSDLAMFLKFFNSLLPQS